MKRESESNRTGGKPNSEHDCIGSWHRIVGAPHALFREVYACRFTMLSLFPSSSWREGRRLAIGCKVHMETLD